MFGQKFGRLTVIHILSKGHSTFWACKCDCGNTCSATTSQLKRGNKKSCGCLRKELAKNLRNKTGGNTLPEGESHFNKLYYQYVVDAKSRSLEFSLTKEEFGTITSQNCHYCCAKPSMGFVDKKTNGSYAHNGIDRRINSEGYILQNCLPCCFRCNRMKGSMDYHDFVAQCGCIYLWRKLDGSDRETSFERANKTT